MALHNLFQNGIMPMFIFFESRISVRYILWTLCVYSMVYVTLVIKRGDSEKTGFVTKTETFLTRWQRHKARAVQYVSEGKDKQEPKMYVYVDDLQVGERQGHLRVRMRSTGKKAHSARRQYRRDEQGYFKRNRSEKFYVFYSHDHNSSVGLNRGWISIPRVRNRLLAMRNILNETTHNKSYPVFDAKIFPLKLETRLPRLDTTKLTLQDNTWQNVPGKSHKLFVYSAFYDRRVPRCVRIISVSAKTFVDSLWCRLWYYDHTAINSTKPFHSVVPAQVERTFILCWLYYDIPAPESVSVVGRLRLPPENLLLVHNTDYHPENRNISVPKHPSPIVDTAPRRDYTKKTKPSETNTISLPKSNETPRQRLTMITDNSTKKTRAQQQDNATTPLLSDSKSMSLIARFEKVTFVNATQNMEKSIAVCVKPLNKNYDKVLRLLEFVEVYRLLGVKQVFLYNYTFGPRTEDLLRYYMARGIVTLLPWQFGILPSKESGYEALIASLNDCLYRTMYAFDFTAFVDIDEIILPSSHATLPKFIKWFTDNMKSNVRGKAGAFSFEQDLFSRKRSDDIEPQIRQKDVLDGKYETTQETGYRLHSNKPPKGYICRPELTVMVEDHGVVELVPGYLTLDVPTSDAMLHLSRECRFGEENCTNVTDVIDNTVDRYGHSLGMALKKRFSKLHRFWSEKQLEINGIQ